ncbi:SapC family protein [Sphingosinicella rhizophila]|uniref:SapC family protein n=1 Tax=Sphingosinicella rhizophila TaxID=3050082 RepID=A0ABU3QBP5_9SPHN|nr:SapC family protein [Sphingosinicella sp. GR2756]MDT9600811.1 SapC family protein [Sphingosinicella sp. GR2756]
MASQAPSNSMPIFYGNLEPLSSTQHGAFKLRQRDKAPQLAKIHAVPITIDEFVSAQRFYPIIFSVGENPVPLALMGLHEGVNVFVDDQGVPIGQTYIPAYVRRYPFMLARLRADTDELSLCFDPTSELVGAYEDGTALFDGGKPSEATNSILKFCEEFELSAQRTNSFMKEVKELDLLMDGEVAIQASDSDKPFIYRGFQMISEEKFRELRGDALRKMNQNGMLPLITAHLFSLQLIREVFAKQIEQKKGPKLEAAKPAAKGKGKA